MNESEIPRDPDVYYPSIHAIQRKRDENIEWFQVAQTIQNGSVSKAEKDKCWMFQADFSGEDKPLRVVANIETGEILTTYWRQEDYEPGV